MNTSPRIVCCTPWFGDDWQWFSDRLEGGEQIQWYFFQDKPRNYLEKKIHEPNLAMIRASWQAVRAAKRIEADLLITHDPRVSFWCALFANLLGLKAEHIAHSFNFPDLPRGLKYRLMKWAFATNIRQFIVYSKLEKQLYSNYFQIPGDRFEVVLWSVGTPKTEPAAPLEPGDYLCAMGGNARDYATLMAAMKQLPEIPIVVVVRPHNLKRLEVPPNVRVRVNLPTPQTMNLLKHSRFMVLPLRGSEVPCGHVTLVAAMHLSKAFIIMNSVGVSDYVIDGYNALTCEPFNPTALAATIRALWEQPAFCQQLGENGKQFAERYCSEESARLHLQNLLAEKGLLQLSIQQPQKSPIGTA
jgi:glycosyltransferase involved in cell wall biosynthesis